MWRCISQCIYPYCNKILSSWLLIGLINSGVTEILVAVECEPSCHFTTGTVLVSLTFPPALPYMPLLWMMVHRGQIITIHCASLPILLKCISKYFINLTISIIGSYYRTTHIRRGWKWECCLAERKGTQSYHRDRNGFKGENEKYHKVIKGVCNEEAENYWHLREHQSQKIDSRFQRKSITLETCPAQPEHGQVYVSYITLSTACPKAWSDVTYGMKLWIICLILKWHLLIF